VGPSSVFFPFYLPLPAARTQSTRYCPSRCRWRVGAIFFPVLLAPSVGPFGGDQPAGRSAATSAGVPCAVGPTSTNSDVFEKRTWQVLRKFSQTTGLLTYLLTYPLTYLLTYSLVTSLTCFLTHPRRGGSPWPAFAGTRAGQVLCSCAVGAPTRATQLGIPGF
jgi:hypothetical protein